VIPANLNTLFRTLPRVFVWGGRRTEKGVDMGQKFVAGILAVGSKVQNVLCTVSLYHAFSEISALAWFSSVGGSCVGLLSS
jgi:hypothetical protein